MVVLGAAFAGYFALLLYSDLTRPEPTGFVFDVRDGAMLLRAVAPDSPAARDGLVVGDRVVTANGHSIHNRLDWLLIETNLQAGQPTHLDVERNGQTHGVDLVLARAPPRFWMTMAGSTLLVARGAQLVTLMVAFVVGFRRPNDRSGRVGAWVLATVAVYSIVLPYQVAAIWRALPTVLGLLLWLPFTSSLAVAAITATFFAVFPRRLVRSPWAWAAIWLPMAAALVPQLQFASRAVYRPDQAASVVDWTRIDVAATAAYTIAALTVMAFGYRHLTDVTERRRVRVLVLGSVVGLASLLPIVIAYWGRPDAAVGDSVFGTPIVALGAILGLAFPASFAYAILRHRLFDVAFIVRRGLQYALARRALVSIVPATAALFLIDLWINRQRPLADVLQARGWAYLMLAGLASVARFRRDRWLDALDRRFFRERHRAERVLRRISEDVRGATNLEAVAPRVVVEIEAALHPQFVALLVRRPSEPLFRAVATVPTSTHVESLSSTSKTAGLLEVLHRPLQTPAADDQAGLVRQLPTDDLEWLRRSNVELLVPVQLRHDVTDALFALGPKRSEEPYSVDDEDLLMAIGASLAAVLARTAPAAHEPDAFGECPDCGACYDVEMARCSQDGATLAQVRLPRLLGGRYRLERRIGQGGMGTVYAALDNALERPVAVKLLREDFVGGRASEERFRSEAQLAAGLTHPNVVTVHDFGVTDAGRAFFVMELLEGLTLRDDLQREGRLTTPRLLSILEHVAAAVDAAHQRGMIHRDLKPENIVLCERDSIETAKILDFGLAKPLEVRAGGALTEVGLVAGTPQYMAPEHRRGADPSPDWDLWALAVMAFEMMTGRLPFSGDPGLTSGFDHPQCADLPDALRQVFARALAMDPLNRPTSAREFVDELERALGAEALR
jgi:tRNA A-37 threonylcarbamoyl transferase component Bud32